MPKNKGRGGNKRRRAKNTNGDIKRELAFKEDGQEYAQVLKLLGSGRCEVYCFDGQKRLGIIRGKLIKRVYIHPGEIVLVSLRDFTKDGKKCDIIHKYFPDEAKKLKAYKEIPENIEAITEQGEYEDNKADVVFIDNPDEDDNDDDSDEESKPRQREMPSSSDEDDDDEDEDDDDEERKKDDDDDDEDEDDDDDDEENDDDDDDEDDDDEEEEEEQPKNKWDNKNKWTANTKTTAPPVKDKRLKETKKADDDYNIDDI